MALVKRLKCLVCNKSYNGNPLSSSPCSHCESKKALKLEMAHFDELDKVSLEERLRRVEKWIYHHKHPANFRDIKF